MAHFVSSTPGKGGTSAFDINDSGVIAGQFATVPNVFHGFTFNGDTLTVFDPPGSTSTEPLSINSSGAIAGLFGDGSNTFTTGFVRDAQGNITTFNVPNFTYTLPMGINSSGEITGYVGK